MRRLVPIAILLALFAIACRDRGATPDSTADDRGASSADRVNAYALHALHAGAKPSVTCDQCHEVVGGQYLRAKSFRCQECHSDAKLDLHAAAAADSGARECFTCHDFTGASKDPIPCAQCHSKPQGGLAAITPHDPNKPDEDCGSCHRAHKDPTLVTTECEGCHKEPVSGHPAKDVLVPKKCGDCHGYHEPASVASGRCTNCHRQSRARVPQTATFTKPDGKGHVACVQCHRPHTFLKEQVIGCRDECHKDIFALAEDKVKQHQGCIGCHDNHDVLGSPQTACLKCHAGKISPKHPKDKASGTPCIGCHPPHRGQGTSLAVECSTCHKVAVSDRGFHQGKDGKGPECKNCHKPHEFDLSKTGPELCLGCHRDKPFPNAPKIDPYVKHTNCFQCHPDNVRHEPTAPKIACATCHKDKGAIVRKGHTNCIGCHEPHTTKVRPSPDFASPLPCGNCHDNEASIAKKDHRTCTNCHDPHTGEQKRACGSCHKDEAATAPKPHQQCTNCHNQHSTEVKTKCVDCHADRATGVHAPVPGGCLSCHRQHGPGGHATVPACTTCHKDLPLMHQVSGHKVCTNCHRSHGEQPNKKRATCIACHKDRANHEPGATKCYGCHPFGDHQ